MVALRLQPDIIPLKLLALISDAYGGRGGIAKFNRDMLSSVIEFPGVTSITTLPRVVVEDIVGVPRGVDFRGQTAGSKMRFARAVLREMRAADYDGVICGHINLLPFAFVAARRMNVPLLLIIHGVDAWTPTGRKITDRLVRHIDHFVVVSDFTRQRFAKWSGVEPDRGTVIPNCIDASAYGPGDKRIDLLKRYGLEGCRILLTFGRMSSQERYKGFDEVLEVLPDLLEADPDLAYLIAGDGDDRPRLEAKARALGLADRVTFAGYVDESEKVDHYRLADAFVMPGRGEGFGVVYLEAMACGVPVVASSLDASREAVLDGELGEVVEPTDPEDLKRGIRAALARERNVPERLEYFSFDRFKERWHAAIADVFVPDTTPSGGS